MTDEIAPPLKSNEFFLKTIPMLYAAPGRYSNHYLRQNSVANPAVMVMPSSPKFLRASFTGDDTAITFTSWHTRHEGRICNLSLSKDDTSGRETWEKVVIAENKTSAKVKFITDIDGQEVLVSEGVEGWKGWMVCQWSLGHPQLFWLTERFVGPIPEFAEGVRIVRTQEMVLVV